MARFFKKRTENKGLAPGALVFIGQKRLDKPILNLHHYNGQGYKQEALNQDSPIGDFPNENRWLNVVGLHDSDLMDRIQKQFGLHPLAMEDVMNTGQRAKFEEFDDHLFITLKMLQFNEETGQVQSEQLSLLFAEDFLISFQEQEGDVFDPVRHRLSEGRGMIRKRGADYLAYALLDTIVDSYIYLIEHLGEKIDDLELRVLDNPDESIVSEINTYKRELHFVMKLIKPVKDLIAGIIRSSSPFIHGKETLPYFKDLEGLILHTLESVDTYRNLLSDYLNLYHTTISSKMNDIMRVLTIFSAIFIPLSFFAGVYGTNFQYFPELQYKYSYFIFWGLILIVAGTMLWYFRRKKWF
ncbi:MAG: magnesium/cobalt transporter CorA [Croceimicrobium sp.]